MTPPKRFRHAGMDWQVEVVKQPFRDEAGDELWGDVDAEQFRVRLRNLHPQLLRQTLFHELTHVACPDMPEEAVAEFERVYGLLRENAPLVKYLFKI